MKLQSIYRHSIGLIAATLLLTSCGKTASNTTGMSYNDKKNGGFWINLNYKGQKTGPGLVFIEGGRHSLGQKEQDVIGDWNNHARLPVTVASFYMDENEVTNADYREYLYWLRRVYVDGSDDYNANYKTIYESALPDTTVWRDKLGYNEIYVESYLRHPAYNFYPVVGVSWEQAMRYCSWRTDRVNEQILIDKGFLKMSKDQKDDQNFSTETYLYVSDPNAVYRAQDPKNVRSFLWRKGLLKDIRPSADKGQGLHAGMEVGIILPKYRLPTEAEWEFAASAGGNRIYNRNIDNNKYTWNGSSLRQAELKNRGDMLANYRRGAGDNMGIHGYLNDQANITMQVRFYPPNDFGLYDMAGNVAEWVLDVYRPLSATEVSGNRPYRGNQFVEFDDDANGVPVLLPLLEPEEGPDGILRLPGQLPIREVETRTSEERLNYNWSDYRNFADGDHESSIYYMDASDSVRIAGGEEVYMSKNSLIDNESRVYKGGSWKDMAYWLTPSARRHLDQDLSTDFIGFRCAMDRVGFQNEDSKRRKSTPKPKQEKFRRYRP
jgi:gliding motility-associated lipoprotein GldJ